MSPIILYFASGDSLYPGAALLFAAVVVLPYFRRGWLRLLGRVVAWAGLVMMVMASPPFCWWVDAGFGSAFLWWVIAEHRSYPGRQVSRQAISALVLVSLVALAMRELSYRRMSRFTGAPSDHLTVIGDSISAGTGDRVPTWPALMQLKTGVAVRNLSRAGAGVFDVRSMAAQITPEDTLILIELGGNDMLAGVPASRFAHGLEALLSNLCTPQRTVVMFELPLLPHWVEYGQIQRRLAIRHRVLLIPKHYFTEVLAGAGATSDGVHLSAVGAEHMVSVVTQLLSPTLTPSMPSTR